MNIVVGKGRLAEELGCSLGTIKNMIKEGKITPLERTLDGWTFDVEACKAANEARLDEPNKFGKKG